MKAKFDAYSQMASKRVTKAYSTSFYMGVSFLDKRIKNDVHAIYGFVRFADEIVDSFHDFDKETLLHEFKEDTYKAIDRKISINPILNAFQHTIHKYNIPLELVDTFLQSMEMDLNPVEYDQQNYETYILGSAEVVGLMCLRVFVYGDDQQYEELKPYAMKLGSAFQKINFLRDLKEDIHTLGRVYFPSIQDPAEITPSMKLEIEKEIEEEFKEAFIGIRKLPKNSRLGVYVSYIYYTKLLKKIKRKTTQELLTCRIRVSNEVKLFLLFKSYVRNSVNLL